MVHLVVISVLAMLTSLPNIALCRSIDDNFLMLEDSDPDVIDLKYLGNAIYGEPDEETGKKVSDLLPDNSTHPEELGNYAEGDILFVNSKTRNGVRNPSKRWPKGIVPYVLRGSFSEQDRRIISQAMDEFHAKSCIKFVPRGNEMDYVQFTNTNTGCWSSVGKVGGAQDVNFQSPGCLYQVGVAIHEMLHALGFMHEQNREDRDSNVVIQWQNVKSGTSANFVKAESGTTDAQNVPYDFDSVLHYSPNAFSTNGQPTIISKIGPKPNMGQRKGFSVGDLQKLNRMYNCPSYSGQVNNPNSHQPGFFELLFNAFRQPMPPKSK